MGDKQLTIKFPEEEFEFLEKCCKRLSVSIEDFIVSSVIEKADSWDDTWMLQEWEKSGKRKKIEDDRKDPNRIVYVKEGDVLKEVRYSDFIKEREDEIRKNNGGE